MCVRFLRNELKIDVCSFPQKRTFTLPQKRDFCLNHASEETLSFSSEELNAQFKSLNSFTFKSFLIKVGYSISNITNSTVKVLNPFQAQFFTFIEHKLKCFFIFISNFSFQNSFTNSNFYFSYFC